jgi:riboflavin kinase
MNNYSGLVHNKKYGSDSTLIHNYEINDETKSAPIQIQLTGIVVSGRGEGSFYMTRKEYLKQFQSELGYIPFPGTLNIKINLKFNSKLLECMNIFDDYKINGFSHEKRSFGWVKCFDAKLDNSIPCHVIRLEKTHHDLSVVELISKHNIRITRNLFDGSTVNVTIMNKQN